MNMNLNLNSNYKMKDIDLEPGLIKRFFFTWTLPIISHYKQNKPQLSNLLQISHQKDFERSLDLLRKNFKEECRAREPSFIKAFLSTFSTELVADSILWVIPFLLVLVECVLGYHLMLHVDNTNQSTEEGVVLVAGIIVLAIVCASLACNSALTCSLFIARVRRVILQILAEKSLRMHCSELNKTDIKEKCVRFVDSDLIELDGFNHILRLFAVITTFIISFNIIGYFIGEAGMIGLLISFSHIPIIFFIHFKIQANQSSLSNFSEKRTQLMEEFINGINILKLYVWEKPFLERIYCGNQKETSVKRLNLNLTTTSIILTHSGLGLVVFISVLLHSALGNDLSLSDLFLMVSIFLVSQTISIVSVVLGVTEIYRILSFFKTIEKTLLTKEMVKPHSVTTSTLPSITLRNVDFSWTDEIVRYENTSEYVDMKSEEDGQVISNITLQINHKGMVLVLGQSGSGKTSLLMGILGELLIESGEFSVKGKLAYASATPWLVPGTVKQNILMGREWNSAKYAQVLKDCNLLTDLEKIQGSDEAFIDEISSRLSTDLQFRIGMARALYSDSSILIIDHPSVISEKIFRVLKNISMAKIVILATHQTYFAPQADKIIVLDRGTQKFVGSAEEMNEREDLQDLIEEIRVKAPRENENFTLGLCKEEETIACPRKGQEEVLPTFHTYVKYTLLGFKSKAILILFCILMVPGQISVIFFMRWCNVLTEDDSEYSIVSLGVLLALIYITAALRSYPMKNLLIHSNQILHSSAMSGLANTEVSYFTSNQAENVAKKFSKEMSTIDSSLASCYYESLSTILYLLGITIAISLIVPYAAIALSIILLLLYWLFAYFNTTIMDLKRNEVNAKEPLISSCYSFVSGYPTIRALNLIHYFSKEIEQRSLDYYRADYALQAALHFTDFYVILALFTIIAANIIAIAATKGAVDLALIGFSLCLSCLFIKSTWNLNRVLIGMHTAMSSVQTLINFSELPAERQETVTAEYPQSNGSIYFVNISARMIPKGTFVLDNLDFYIEGGSKFGIVGTEESGAGIMQVLTRLTTPELGVVLIDGIDHMRFSLRDLRLSITVIPQNSFLFSASVRDNLDPSHEFTDGELLDVLDEVHLYVLDENKIRWLNHLIVGQDLIFSESQKILLGFARALLKKNKIVLVEESSKRIDLDTENIIENLMDTKFIGSTLVVISKKLRTVMNCDKIAVIKNGACSELGKPTDLLKEKNSIFRTLVMNTENEETHFPIKNYNRYN